MLSHAGSIDRRNWKQPLLSSENTQISTEKKPRTGGNIAELNVSAMEYFTAEQGPHDLQDAIDKTRGLQCNCYRPISLLSAQSKVFARV